ncbi:MAG: hypothetical protein ACTSRK_10100 [Promethearchaeota archaeon]
MKIRDLKNRRIKSVLMILITLSPSIFVGVYINNCINFFDDMVSFTDTIPDETTFIYANYSRLSEVAEFYDQRYEEFHIPLNFSTDTKFTDANCTEVDYYIYSDNGGQWTGLAVTGWVFKYIAALNEQNETLEEDSLRVIRKLLHGMSMMLAVPNGGIGPNYSGILARGWADPAHKNISQFYFSENDQHHNGTGIYSNWRWRCYTSLDEYSGVYSGLGLIFKYVKAPDVQELASLMIDQLAQYMVDSNFLGIDWHGGPTGVVQRARLLQGGVWGSLLLKMAALAIPEKYQKLYYHYTSEDFYAYWSKESSKGESVSNYYAIAFGTHITFALLMLEEDSALRDLFLRRYMENLWAFSQSHRNSFYNVVQLAINYEPGQNTILERDIEDQLMRYDCEYHFPDRKFGHAPIPDDYVPIDTIDELFAFFENDPHGSLYRPIFSEVEGDEIFYQKPLTVEYMEGDIFIWEENPYTPEEPYIDPTYEYAGFSFTVVYWIARAFGFIAESGSREVI